MVDRVTAFLAQVEIGVLIFFVMAFLPGQILGQSQGNFIRSQNGIVLFTSDAPLEVINARSQTLRGIIDQDQNTFAFAIDMKSFEGFNSDLQRTHFNENYVESKRFPKSTFTGKIIENVDWSKPGINNVRAKGILEIHGVAQERIIPSRMEIFADRVIIQAEFKVPLRDHDIDIPKIVAQKISEEINVSIHLVILLEGNAIE